MLSEFFSQGGRVYGGVVCCVVAGPPPPHPPGLNEKLN